MASDRSARLDYRVVWVWATAALLAGCSSNPPQAWERPAEPRPLEEERGAWPPPKTALLDFLVVSPSPRDVLPLKDAWIVSTGYGITWLGDDGSARLDLATPGWSHEAVEVGDEVWVADGPGGLACFGGEGRRLRLERSLPLGDITALAAGGRHVLATDRAGRLLVLEATEDGPRLVAELLVDGGPRDVAVSAGPGDPRWIVALDDAGAVEGVIAADGRPLVTRRHRAWAQRVALTSDGNVRSGAAPTLSADESDRVLLPAAARDLIGDGDAVWIAAGEAGVLRFEGGEHRSIRERSGARATGIGLDPSGALHVAWSDGAVERLDRSGTPAETRWLGPPARITGASGRYFGRILHGGASELVDRSGGARIRLTQTIPEFVVDGEDLLVAAASLGLLHVNSEATARGESPVVVARADAQGVRRGPDGRLWVADEERGLRVFSDEEEQLHAFRGGGGAVAVDVSETWAVGVSYEVSELVAVRLGGASETLHAGLIGSARDVQIVGDYAVVGIARYGVEVVPLDRGSWPETRPMALPMPASTTPPSARLCGVAGGERVLVTLGERGVAEVGIGADGAPALHRIIETPGNALDCAPSESPGTWLIADETALLELRLSPG